MKSRKNPTMKVPQIKKAGSVPCPGELFIKQNMWL